MEIRMNDKTSRRQFIAYSAALASTVAACGREESDDSGVAVVGSAKPMIDLTAVEALAAMNAGEFSAEEYASALLENAAEWEHLNAWISFEPEQVLAAARLADVGARTSQKIPPTLQQPVKNHL